MRILISLTLIGFALGGCAKAVTNFVQKAKHVEEGVVQLPSVSTTTGSSKAMNISGGATSSAGAQVEGVLHIGPTKFVTKGSQVDAKLSINRNRYD